MSNNKKNKSSWLVIISFICIFSFVLFGTNLSNVNDVFQRDRFTGGSIIEGVDVSGMTVEQANSLLVKSVGSQLKDVTISMNYADRFWKLDSSDIDISESIKQTVDKAFDCVKTQGITLSNQKQYELSTNELLNSYHDKIDKVIMEIEQEPINANVSFNPDASKMFTINTERVGIKVNKQDVYEQLEQGLKSRTKDIAIDIKTYEVEPEVKQESFFGKQELMGEFSTTLKNSKQGRRYNVNLALSKFNGLIVEPDQIISFNKITGPQTLQGGYQPAIIIKNGVFTEGVGGGLCQASTTLYNACLLANMEIIEVHKHTLPVGYVELALDAMVSDDYSDFVFKNSSSNPIYIKSYVQGDSAIVELYGKSKDDGVEIKRVSEVVKKIPHKGDKIIPDTNKEYSSKVTYKGELYRLKYPREGSEVKAYLEYYKDNVLIDKKEIRHEKYMSSDGIVVEGTEPLPEEFVLPEQDVTIIAPQNLNT